MSSRIAVIFTSEQRWRVGMADEQAISLHEVPTGASSSIEERMNALREFATARQIEPGDVILAIPSGWCLGAGVELSPAEHQKHAAALFALEEKLPIAAEEVVADFDFVQGGAFGVCIERARIGKIVSELELRGWNVKCGCPTSLLAMAEVAEAVDQISACDLLVGTEDESIVVMRLSNGHLMGWHVTSSDPSDIKLLLEMLSLQSVQPALRIWAADLPDEVLGAVRSIDGISVRELNGTDSGFISAAARAGSRILSSRLRVPFDLHPAGLRRAMPRNLRRALIFATVSVTLAVVALNAAFLIAGSRMESRARQYQHEQATLFRQVVPDTSQRVPTQVARYLSSEHQRFFGVGTNTEFTNDRPAVLSSLVDIFSRLPRDVPLQIQRLRIEGGQSEISGKVATHDLAGQLVSAMGNDGQLKVGPVQNAATPDSSVAFTIHIEHDSSSSAGGETP